MRYLLIVAVLITMGLGCSQPNASPQAPHYDNGIFQTQNEILYIGRDTVKAEWNTDQEGNLYLMISDQDKKRIPLFGQADKLFVRGGSALFEKNRGQGTVFIADAVEMKSPPGSNFFIDVLNVVIE